MIRKAQEAEARLHKIEAEQERRQAEDKKAADQKTVTRKAETKKAEAKKPEVKKPAGRPKRTGGKPADSKQK